MSLAREPISSFLPSFLSMYVCMYVCMYGMYVCMQLLTDCGAQLRRGYFCSLYILGKLDQRNSDLMASTVIAGVAVLVHGDTAGATCGSSSIRVAAESLAFHL